MKYNRIFNIWKLIFWAIAFVFVLDQKCHCMRVIKDNLNKNDQINSSFYDNFIRELSEPIPIDRESHRIHKIPGLIDELENIKQFAGHIPVDPISGGHHFYWLFENHDIQLENKPLIIWLNGNIYAFNLLF